MCAMRKRIYTFTKHVAKVQCEESECYSHGVRILCVRTVCLPGIITVYPHAPWYVADRMVGVQ